MMPADTPAADDRVPVPWRIALNDKKGLAP